MGKVAVLRDTVPGRRPKDASRSIQRAVRENRLDGRNRWVRAKRQYSSALLAYYGLQDELPAQIVADDIAFKVIIVAAQQGRVIRDGGPVLPNGDLHVALRKNGYGSYSNSIERGIALLEEMSERRRRADRGEMTATHLAEHGTATADAWGAPQTRRNGEVKGEASTEAPERSSEAGEHA